MKVLMGNVVMYPEVIRKFLAKRDYFLMYDESTESLTLRARYGYSGLETLFEIRNVPYESAIKLAKGLGLKGDGATWTKLNPILLLDHDGSEAAESLRMEMLRLGIPHQVHQTCTLGLISFSGGMALRHSLPMWTVDQMLSIIRETAEKNKEELAATP